MTCECNNCNACRCREYYRKNKDKVRKTQTKYYVANLAEQRKRGRDYYHKRGERA